MKEIKKFLEDKLEVQKNRLKEYEKEIDLACVAPSMYDSKIESTQLIIDYLEAEINTILV